MRSLHRVLIAATAAVGLGLGGTAVAAAQPMTMPQQDSDFLIALHQGSMTEMLSGAAASVMGGCPQVRDTAMTLVRDHARLDAMDAAIALPNGVALPLTPNADQRQAMMDTSMKSGRDYDLAWLHMQETFHTQTLQAGANEVATGADAQVTALAREAAPIVQNHLTMIQNALAVC